MVITWTTNVASLNARRNLYEINTHLAKSMQRLASGQRINSAADDPAGLAISERLRAQIRSLTRAQLNANDAISMTQVAEGALNTISAMVIRMRELAIQADNGCLSGPDRDSLQEEFHALAEEINRIALATTFNGTSLLSGNHQVTFQVGAGTTQDVDTITLTLEDMGDGTLGLMGLDIGSGGDVTYAIQHIDAAADIVTGYRGKLGAFQNRLQHTIHNLGAAIENLSAAESRIRDVDVALEVANLTKYTIMQQVAVAVLKQANLQPQRLLALLQ